MAREFIAKIRTGTGGFNLQCCRCNTIEHLEPDTSPHDAAVYHAEYLHAGRESAARSMWKQAHRRAPNTGMYSL